MDLDKAEDFEMRSELATAMGEPDNMCERE